MEEGTGQDKYRDEIYSKSVRAGKRTYFFDVKSTRGNDLYLTITESKKRYNNDGRFYFEKHKLFLYKEDFEKFTDGLEEVIDKINELKANGEYPSLSHDHSGDEGGDKSQNSQSDTTENTENKSDDYESSEEQSSDYTDVKFDDLGE